MRSRPGPDYRYAKGDDMAKRTRKLLDDDRVEITTLVDDLRGDDGGRERDDDGGDGRADDGGNRRADD